MIDEEMKTLILQIVILIATLIATISMEHPGWFIFGLATILFLD